MALTDKGFEIPTLDEIVEDIGNRQKFIFPDLNTSASTPDGQLNGLLSEAIMVSFEANLAIYGGLNPNTAEGIMLDRVCALTGVQRKDGFPSTVMMRLNGVAQTVVPAETIFADTEEPPNRYRLAEDTVIDQYGRGNGIATSFVNDNIFSGADEITVIETPVNGLGTVTNQEAVVPGRQRESDHELRIRRYKSTALPGTALLDSVYAELMATKGVLDAKVYENVEAIDSPEGLKPHSIYPVVYGGQDLDIASAIMRSKSLGSGLNGNTLTQWVDIQNIVHTVLFQRPLNIPIFINVEVITPEFDEGVVSDVKSKIMSYVEEVRVGKSECAVGRFMIADDVFASAFYYPFADSDYTISEILVGDADPATGTRVAIDIDQMAFFNEDNINVVEVP